MVARAAQFSNAFSAIDVQVTGSVTVVNVLLATSSVVLVGSPPNKVPKSFSIVATLVLLRSRC